MNGFYYWSRYGNDLVVLSTTFDNTTQSVLRLHAISILKLKFSNNTIHNNS